MDADSRLLSSGMTVQQIESLDWCSAAPESLLKHLSNPTAGAAMFNLAMAKMYHSEYHRRAFVILVLNLIVSMAVSDEWSREKRRPGFLTDLATEAVSNLFAPGLRSDRPSAWCGLLLLEKRWEWTRIWKPRYAKVMWCLADMAQAMNDFAVKQIPNAENKVFFPGDILRSKSYGR